MMEGIMVKDEPLDPEYDNALGTTEEEKPEPEMEAEDSQHNINNGDSKLNIKIKTVIDDILQKNDKLLESTDVTQYKVGARSMYEEYHSEEFGRMLRLKNPTINCFYTLEEEPKLKDYLVELSVGDVNVEDIFEKMKYEVVCGIVSKAYAVNDIQLNTENNLKFYWCNFCRFKSENKEALLKHVIEHRFHCKCCDYQSFSRANVISHAERMHLDFRENAKTLKYCIFRPDFSALSNDGEERKRHIKDKPGPASKRFRKDQAKSQEKDEYVAFDMEVEEVDDGNSYTPNDGESSDRIMTPRTTKKNQNAPIIEKLPKTISTASKSTVNESSASKQATGTSIPPPLPSGNMQTTTTGKSGNTVTVSSGLCWNCGYCSFVTLSQTFLKTHLNSHHVNKAHKYVAMLVSSQEEMNKIKERDAKMFTPWIPPHLQIGNVPQEQTSSPLKEVGAPTSSTSNSNSATSAVNEDVVEDESDEEYIPEEEKKKYPLTYKCAHCNFNAPVCFIVKEHLNMKHKGCVLYALDMRAVKLKQKRYVFFCHRNNCSFTTKKPEEYLSHSESCTPWLLENCPEVVDVLTKTCLQLTRNFSSKISQKAFQMAKNFTASKSAEYACIHCNYTSNNNTRVKKHVLTNHEELETVLKDLQSHKMKKKTNVYFCRHCLWETRDEEELDDHLQEKHKDEEEALTASSTPPVKEAAEKKTVEKKTPRQAPSRSMSSKPDQVIKKEDDIKAEKEEEDKEEEMDLHLEVSEEDMQKMMTEFVKDEAGRGSLPGRPARKASIEASVRVRAQGHQPPMYKCMYCTHLCFGGNLMKKHIRTNHQNEALRTVDVKKRISRQFSYYCMCPQDNCTFVNSSEEKVLNHALQQHRMNQDHPEIQKMLQPFAAQSFSSAETQSTSVSKGASVLSSLVGFECLYCSTTYVTKEMDQMKDHIKEQHPSEEIIFRDCVARKLRKSSRIYMCERDNCDYYNSEQEELELHKLAHEKAHIFECSECQWFTSTKDYVPCHMETVHSGERVTARQMYLDLDEQGQVIKKLGGMIIKQEKKDPEHQEDTEPMYLNTTPEEFVIKEEIVVFKEQHNCMDLKEQGQVIKKLGGMIIKQEKQDPEHQEDTEPVFSNTTREEFVIKEETVDFKEQHS